MYLKYRPYPSYIEIIKHVSMCMVCHRCVCVVNAGSSRQRLFANEQETTDLIYLPSHLQRLKLCLKRSTVKGSNFSNDKVSDTLSKYHATTTNI